MGLELTANRYELDELPLITLIIISRACNSKKSFAFVKPGVVHL